MRSVRGCRRQLVERLMQLKLAEAEKLNSANAMYEDVMRRANTVKRATVSTLLGAIGGHRASLTLTLTHTPLRLVLLPRGEVSGLAGVGYPLPPSRGARGVAAVRQPHSVDILVGARVFFFTAPVDMRRRGDEAAAETPEPKKVAARWVANAGGCHMAAFDSTGSRLATVGVDKLVQVWEPSSGVRVGVAFSFAGCPFATAFADPACSCSFSPNANRYPAGTCTSTLRSALQTVVDVAFSPDDNFLLAASRYCYWHRPWLVKRE